MNILWVVAGSALGGLARYYVGLWVTNASGDHMLGTVLVNVVGSFVIGLFLVMSVDRSWSGSLVLFVAVGILGGFTTFSTFAWHTYELSQNGDVDRALLNVGASVGASLVAVWGGASVARFV